MRPAMSAVVLAALAYKSATGALRQTLRSPLTKERGLRWVDAKVGMASAFACSQKLIYAVVAIVFIIVERVFSSFGTRVRAKLAGAST